MIISSLHYFYKLGFASICGYQVSEIDEMLDVRKIMGVCQQIDIFFDVLTVEENLSIIASVKGIHPNDVIQEVSQLNTTYIPCPVL